MVAGKIKADPNPIPFGQSSIVISWETSDSAAVEVRVSTSPDHERLVAQASCSGQTKIPWIVDSRTYDFRLYAAGQPDTPIDSVKVTRDLKSVPIILRHLADEAQRGNIDIAELSQFIATVMPNCLHGGKFAEIFRLWERHGFHVTPVHFYQPIPDTQSLPEESWKRPSELVGIDMNDPLQLELLRKHFSKFQNEYGQFSTTPVAKPSQFYLNNGLFDGTDALVA